MSMVSKLRGKTFFNKLLVTTAALFTANTAGSVAKGYDSLALPQVVTVSLTAKTITTTDATTSGAYGSLKLADMPATNLLLLGATMNLALTGDGTGITSTAAVVASVGTAAEAANGTLDSTQADIVASTAATLTASAGTAKAVGAGPQVINAQSGKSVYLNLGAPDAGSTANGSIIVTGTVKLFYIDLGTTT